jgi:aspartyl-tRNA(Asn)/glutamyl-tRNA(Gln) amidotransferase subunit A
MNLNQLSAGQMLDGYRTGEFTPVEVAQACLARIDETATALNAFCLVDSDRTLAEAEASAARWAAGSPQGLLDGVPVSIKDLIDVAGWPTMCGTRVIRPEEAVAREDALTVARLRAAGAVLLGKTTTTEFGHKGVSDSPLTGATHNPWNREMTTGGSSCGAGAAAAAGLGPLHLGNDGGGSVRIPASFCGVVGIKPGAGTIPQNRPSITGPLVAPGPLARSLEDAALMLDVLAGTADTIVADGMVVSTSRAGQGRMSAALSQSAGDIKLGFLPTISEASVDADVAALVSGAVKLLEGECACAETTSLDLPQAEETYIAILSAGTAMMADDYPAERQALMEPALQELVRVGRTVTGQAYAAAYHRARGDYMARLRDLFARFDALVLPTMPCTAFPLWHDYPGPQNRGWHADWTPFTFPFNLMGLPACTLPCGLDAQGLPVGIQLVAPWGGEATILRLAAALRRHLPPLLPPLFVTKDGDNAAIVAERKI